MWCNRAPFRSKLQVLVPLQGEASGGREARRSGGAADAVHPCPSALRDQHVGGRCEGVPPLLPSRSLLSLLLHREVAQHCFTVGPVPAVPLILPVWHVPSEVSLLAWTCGSNYAAALAINGILYSHRLAECKNARFRGCCAVRDKAVRRSTGAEGPSQRDRSWGGQPPAHVGLQAGEGLLCALALLSLLIIS